MTEYSQLKEKGMRRGRPKHTEEQKAVAEITNKARTEARRRAGLVLKDRYKKEFEEIYNVELKECISELELAVNRKNKMRSDVAKLSKSTRK